MDLADTAYAREHNSGGALAIPKTHLLINGLASSHTAVVLAPRNSESRAAALFIHVEPLILYACASARVHWELNCCLIINSNAGLFMLFGYCATVSVNLGKDLRYVFRIYAYRYARTELRFGHRGLRILSKAATRSQRVTEFVRTDKSRFFPFSSVFALIHAAGLIRESKIPCR